LNPLDNKLLVKRRGDPIRISRLPLQPQKKPSVLGYWKSGDSFTVYLDRERLAEFTDTPAFLPASDNRLFIFLRPGEHLVLHSIQVKYKSGRKAGTFQPGDASVTVQYKGSTFFFNVYSEPQVFNNKNYTLYRLENVTGLKKDIATLQREKNHLAQRIRQETEFVGQAPSILKIKENIPVVAGSDLSVLIEGETGTGKEVLARSIHEASRRHEKPFMKIDCSAIPENLLESELFGHAKGAFTGAQHDHKGRFEQAQGGTVFLDEIANLPMSTQAKLLNVLQDFKVQPIGSTQTVKLDIKLITASNIPLNFYIRQGKFREDLFYRLNQFSFRLPGLGERPEDVPLLAGHFLKEANALYEKSITGFSSAALTKIYNTSWPGNIRQLRNAVLRAVLFCQEKMIQPKDIALEEASGKVLSAALGKSPVRKKQGRLTKKGLMAALKEENGKILRVAKRFNVCRLTVYRKLREFRINIDGYRKMS
jgi:DNA-binding NtrC family response regulator